MAAQPTESALKDKDGVVTVRENSVEQVPPDKVPFEAYLHFAEIQRKREDDLYKSSQSSGDDGHSFLNFLSAFKRKGDDGSNGMSAGDDEKVPNTTPDLTVTDDERAQARQAVRTATWLSIFYLITTDILGPYSAPWAFAQVGFASGSLLFFFMGIAAFYTGMLLWHMYIKLDSNEYPVLTYSDLAKRIFGVWAGHSVNILQTVQLLFNVGVIILSNAQGLAQISHHRVCFSALVVIWTLVGMFFGQIRSLQNFGFLAHSSIWMNLIVIFITMGAVAHSPPNFDGAKQQNDVDPGPIMTSAFIHQSFKPQVVAVMQMVYSYGGAMLFIELMAEMKRPFDFWKGMVYAQIFIVTVYMMFGVYVYAFQGQFTINPANQGISGYGLQTATNVISLVAAIIAAALYGNIGIKVIYANIVQNLFNGPELVSRSGRVIWVVMVLVYWAVAFIIGSAIPQLSNVSGVVAAICILQFTYTFPPIMHVGFLVQQDATEGDDAFTPGNSVSATRRDTWSDWSRWWRGFSKHWWLNTINILIFLAAGATAGLGAFSSIEGIIDAFKRPHSATSFGCQAPV